MHILTAHHQDPVEPQAIFYRVWNLCRQVSCMLIGHRDELAMGSGKLGLRCDRCGWTSPGWTVSVGEPR